MASTINESLMCVGSKMLETWLEALLALTFNATGLIPPLWITFTANINFILQPEFCFSYVKTTANVKTTNTATITSKKCSFTKVP